MNTDKNDLRQYADLVKSIRIDHLAYEQVLEALEESYDSVGHTANPVCVHIAGEYRTGKSCVIDDFLARHPVERYREGLRQSIVYTLVPHDATVKGLVQALLRAFGDPHWARGSTSNQTARLLDYLESTGCRMIILDEFQHLCDKGQKKQLYKAADWLKILIEKKPWALVAAGLPESASVINSNRQLQGRFDATLTMPLFDWHDASSRAQFRAIVHAFVTEMRPFELPDLGGDELALRVFLATSGRVGLFAKLMDRVVGRAIRDKTTKIRVQDLANAFQRAIWFAPRFPLPQGPFFGDLSHGQNAIIEKVVALGAEEEAYKDGAGRVRRQGVETKVSGRKLERQRQPRHRTQAQQKEELRRAL